MSPSLGVSTPHTRHAARLGLIGAGALALTAVVFTVWATTAPLASAVVADAELKPELSRRVVQHQEGGIVRQILVRNGEHVNAGQVLITLDDRLVRAQAGVTREQLDSDLAKAARLEAERSLAAHITFPGELLARENEPEVRGLLQRERDQFTSRRQALEFQRTSNTAALRQSASEMSAMRAAAEASQESTGHARKQLDAHEKLFEAGYISQVRMLDLRRLLSEALTKERELQSEIYRSQQRHVELERQSRALVTEYVQSANAEIKQTQDSIHRQRAQLDPTSDAMRRQDIVAPVAGRVVGMQLNTEGAVVKSGETILEIVPDDAPILVVARLRTDAVEQVAVGGTAGVALRAFDQRKMPIIEGRVTYVSADRQKDRDTGAAYYDVHVALPEAALRAAQVTSLKAGMPAEVYFSAGKRTALSYLVDPFTGRMRRALRDK